MRLFLCLISLGLAASAQTPSAPAADRPKPGDTVFVLNGKSWTRDAWDTFLDSLPEGTQQTVKSNPAEFIRQLAVIDHLTGLAEKQAFLDKEPYKTRWAVERLKIISTFFQEHTQNNTGATDEEVRAYYSQNADRFTTVTLKMIYLAPPASGSDLPVRAKAEEIYQQIMKGADFVKMVREHSEEPGSKGRDGDLGTMSKSDSLPEEVKAVVFKLKKGDVTKPVTVSNGLYIFRCEEAKVEKFDDVKETLRTELRQKKYMDWFRGESANATVKFVRQDYISK